MGRFVIFLFFSLGAISAQTSIINSKHDLSATSAGATIKAQSELGVCVFCHTAHSTAQIDQLWNKTLTQVVSYTLYSSERLTLAGYPTPSQPNDKSKLCMSCHDGTIALGSVYNTPGSGTSGEITMVGGITTMPVDSAGYIGVDLSDDHPIGYAYDPDTDPDLIVKAWPWSGDVLLDPNASNGTVECHTCHNVHDNTNQPFLNLPKANLCSECHSKTGWTESKHAATINCGGCHKAHGGGASLLVGLEENTCYQSDCHGSTSPATGSSGRTLDIASQMVSVNAHPTNSISGIHISGESSAADYQSPDKRHAECFDCHDPHQAGGTTSGIATALKGAWGVAPTYSSTLNDNVLDNDVVLTPPTSYTALTTSTTTYEYQLCLKCHSDYTTQPAGQRNIAEEINPYYRSSHGIYPRAVKDGSDGTEPRNSYVNASTMEAPFNEDPLTYTREVLCSDCHTADLAGAGDLTLRTTAIGAHGSSVIVGSLDPFSNQSAMLVATIASNATDGTPLCHVCHSRSNYWDGTLITSGYSEHPSDRGSKHMASPGCFTCHMWEHSENAPSGGDSQAIYIHGMNKRWNLWETPDNNGVYSAGSLQLTDAFVSGYIADIDFINKNCWTTESVSDCNRGHSGTGYGSTP